MEINQCNNIEEIKTNEVVKNKTSQNSTIEKDKLTEEEINEINRYTADMYHRAMVKIAFDDFEKIEDIQEIAKESITKFAINELEICNTHKNKNMK